MGETHRWGGRQRSIMLSGFWMYKNLVTVEMYLRFRALTRRKHPPAPYFNRHWLHGDHPIVNVTWFDAAAYATWAGADLPMEAQWEKAARGTEGLIYPWGNEWDASKLWCSKTAYQDAGGTTAVGVYGISPYGCTDMAGNAWQWCRDWYSLAYTNSPLAAGLDPDNQSAGPKKERVVRGGAWLNRRLSGGSAFRKGKGPAFEDDDVGFRCMVRASAHEHSPR